MSFIDLLRSYNASNDMIEFARNKTWREFYDTCERIEWLIWLHQKTNKDDSRKRLVAIDDCIYTIYDITKVSDWFYRYEEDEKADHLKWQIRQNPNSKALIGLVKDIFQEHINFEDFNVLTEE